MSYYTKNRLSWDTPEPSEEDVISKLAELMGENRETVEDIALHRTPATWYDAEQQISKLSQDHPDTVFTVDCEGEDDYRGITFFRNGLNYRRDIIAPVFDEDAFSKEAKPPAPTPTTTLKAAPGAP